MGKSIIPEGYQSALNLYDTQVGIKTVKDFFQNLLAERLNLLRVTAPLFVEPESGFPNCGTLLWKRCGMARSR